MSKNVSFKPDGEPVNPVPRPQSAKPSHYGNSKPRVPRPQTAKVHLSRNYETRDWIPEQVKIPIYVTGPKAAPPKPPPPKKQPSLLSEFSEEFQGEEHDEVVVNARDIFAKYDKDRSGQIDIHELTFLLEDSGVLKHMAVDEASAYLEDIFHRMDKNADHQIGFHEFETLLKIVQKEHKNVNVIKGLERALISPEIRNHKGLKRIFASFVKFGKRGTKKHYRITDLCMTGPQWAKLCRENGLLDTRDFTVIAADIVFMRAKEKFQRTIGYVGFLDALAAVALKKKMPLGEVVGMVLAGGEAKDPRLLAAEVAPQENAELPSAIARVFELYDTDQSGSLDRGEAAYLLADLGVLQNITTSDAGLLLEREFNRIDKNRDGVISRGDFMGFWKNLSQLNRVRLKKLTADQSAAGDSTDLQDLKNLDSDKEKGRFVKKCQDVFHKFCSWTGSGDSLLRAETKDMHAQLMDRGRWVKCCRDAGILNDTTMTQLDAEIIFSRAKPRGEFRIGFREFWIALKMAALDAQCDVMVLARHVVNTGGPVNAAKRESQHDANKSKVKGGRENAINKEREKKCRDVFRFYDTNGDRMLDKQEMTFLLQDMGMLLGMRPAHASSMISSEFAKLDTARTGKISFDQFTLFFRSMNNEQRSNLSTRATHSHLTGKAPDHYKHNLDLKRVFHRFCIFGRSPISVLPVHPPPDLGPEEMDAESESSFASTATKDTGRDLWLSNAHASDTFVVKNNFGPSLAERRVAALALNAADSKLQAEIDSQVPGGPFPAHSTRHSRPATLNERLNSPAKTPPSVQVHMLHKRPQSASPWRGPNYSSPSASPSQSTPGAPPTATQLKLKLPHSGRKHVSLDNEPHKVNTQETALDFKGAAGVGRTEIESSSPPTSRGVFQPPSPPPRARPASAQPWRLSQHGPGGRGSQHFNPEQPRESNFSIHSLTSGQDKGDFTENGHMSSGQWLKLCRDCFLEHLELDKGTADVIFAQVKPLRTVKITFDDFLKALALVALETGKSFDSVASYVMRTQRPLPQHGTSSFTPLYDRGTERQRTFKEFEEALQAWGEEHVSYLEDLRGRREDTAEKSRMHWYQSERRNSVERLRKKTAERKVLETSVKNWDKAKMSSLVRSMRNQIIESRA